MDTAQSTDVDNYTSTDVDEGRVAILESAAGVNLPNAEQKFSVSTEMGTQG